MGFTFYLYIIGGLICIVSGIGQLKWGWDMYHGFKLPYYSVHFSIFLGISFIVLALIKNKKLDAEDTFVICKYCKKTYNQNDVKQNQCPECKNVMEPLEGVYERHPELLSNDEH